MPLVTHHLLILHTGSYEEQPSKSQHIFICCKYSFPSVSLQLNVDSWIFEFKNGDVVASTLFGLLHDAT